MSNKAIITQPWTIDVVDTRTGIILHRQTKCNAITTAGMRVLAARAIGDNGGKYYTHAGIGTGSREENAGDTDLEQAVDSRVALSTHGDVSAYSGSIRISARFSRQSQDRLITEMGIFDAATGGNLLARITTQSPAPLTSTQSVTATIPINIAEG